MLFIKANAKMGTLLGLFFLTFVMNAKFDVAEGAVDSSPDSALRFAQCLIEKMSESQFFTIEDRNSIMEVANVMAQAMKHRYQTNISIKILVIAFVTSMADVVIHEDPAKNTHRKGVYASSLEQCSLSSAGYVDVDLIMEALRIINSIEHSKLSKISRGGEATNARNYNPNMQQPKVFDPLLVQPSPVQVQRAPGNFNPNDRARFEQQRRPFNSYPSPFNPRFNPQFRPSATSGFPSASKTRMSLQAPNFSGFPPGINPGSMLQATANTRFSLGSNPGSKLPAASNTGFSSDQLVPNAEFPMGSHAESISQVAPKQIGLQIPQTKESSVVVIPPSENKNVPQAAHFQNNPPQNSREMDFQPPRLDRPPIPEGSIPSSEYLPQSGKRTMNAPPNPGLERTIQNILKESSIFKNTFNFDIPQEKAIHLASSITEQSLKDYNLDLVTQAVAAVSEEVAKVSYQTPENYALALANALVNILKLHDLPIFVEGSRIANNFLFNLDYAKRNSSQPPKAPEQPNKSDSVNPEEKPHDISFESPPFSPEDTEGGQFSEVLQKCLKKSDEFSNFFCNNNNPEDRSKVIFSVIMLSLSEFGTQVSSVAASVVSSALAEQSTEELCSNFAQIISDGISEALDERAAVLEGANAQDISKKLIFNFNSQIQNLKSSGIGSEDKAEYTTIESYNTMQPSPSSDDSSENETSKSSEINYATSDDLNEKLDADSASYMLNSGPPSPIQMSPVEKTNPVGDDYTVPFTTTDFSTEMNEELTRAISITEVIIDLWELSTTESSDTVWTSEPDEAKDQKSLASHLLESFESALGALLGVSDGVSEGISKEQETPSDSSDTSLASAETVEDTQSAPEDTQGAPEDTQSAPEDTQSPPKDTQSALINVEDTQSEPISVEDIEPKFGRKAFRTRQRIERRRRKKTTTASDAVTPSIIQTENKNINYDHQSTSEEITDIGKSPEFSSKDSPNQQQDEHKVISDEQDTSSFYSKNSSRQADFVELQPSFQGPPLTETKSNQKVTPNFNTSIYSSESKASSVLIANSVSQKAAESIAYIRRGNSNMGELCSRLNEFAPIVNIPPLDYCAEIPAIDYLLNVLMSTIKITTNVN